MRRKVLAGLDYIAVAPKVVAVARDVPIPADLDDAIPRSPADPDRIVELATRWGIESSATRLTRALGGLA